MNIVLINSHRMAINYDNDNYFVTFILSGLRMFSYPWSENENSLQIEGGTHIENSFMKIGRLNKILSERTAVHLKNSKKAEVGSCNYNLTLINRCYPINSSEVKMKFEPTFNNEKCTVSWHADSTLEHYSSIAVYHCTREKKTKSTEKIALAKLKAAKIEKRRKSEEKKSAIQASSNISALSGQTLLSTLDTSIEVSMSDNKRNDDISSEMIAASTIETSTNIQIQENNCVDDSWRISLRVCPNAEGPKAGKLKLGTYSILYYTILYYTILYYTILYYTILYYAMLY